MVPTLRVYYAMLTGQVLFLGAALFIVYQSGSPFYPALHAQLQYISPAVAGALILLSNFLFNKQVEAAQAKASEIGKVQAYQFACIMRTAMVDGVGLFMVVCYMLTGHWQYLLLFAAVLGFFVWQRPTPEACAQDLEL